MFFVCFFNLKKKKKKKKRSQRKSKKYYLDSVHMYVCLHVSEGVLFEQVFLPALLAVPPLHFTRLLWTSLSRSFRLTFMFLA